MFVFLVLGQAFSLAKTEELSQERIETQLKQYAELKAFRARFTQVKHLNEMNLDLKSEGDLTVQRPNRIVWNVTRPSPLKLTLEGAQVSMTQGEGSEKKNQTWSLNKGASAKEMKGLEDLMAWLSLDAKRIGENYRLIDEGNRTFLCLIKNPNAPTPFQNLRMTLSPQGYLQKLSIDEKSGDNIQIQFTAPERIQ